MCRGAIYGSGHTGSVGVTVVVARTAGVGPSGRVVRVALRVGSVRHCVQQMLRDGMIECDYNDRTCDARIDRARQKCITFVLIQIQVQTRSRNNVGLVLKTNTRCHTMQKRCTSMTTRSMASRQLEPQMAPMARDDESVETEASVSGLGNTPNALGHIFHLI